MSGTVMHKPVVIVGLGEMGSVFARGFLRAGYPVVPVVRGHQHGSTGGRTARSRAGADRGR